MRKYQIIVCVASRSCLAFLSLSASASSFAGLGVFVHALRFIVSFPFGEMVMVIAPTSRATLLHQDSHLSEFAGSRLRLVSDLISSF